jgi:hypothetical protein
MDDAILVVGLVVAVIIVLAVLYAPRDNLREIVIRLRISKVFELDVEATGELRLGKVGHHQW